MNNESQKKYIEGIFGLASVELEIDALKTAQNMIKSHPEMSPVSILQYFISSLERLANDIREERK